MDKTTTERVSVGLLESREEEAREESLEFDTELEIFTHFKKLQDQSNKQSRDMRDAAVKIEDKKCINKLQDNHKFFSQRIDEECVKLRSRDN